MSAPLSPFRPDPQFFTTVAPIAVGEAVALAQADLHQPSAAGQISHVSPADRADNGALVYIEGKGALEGLATKVPPALVLTTEGLVEKVDAIWPGVAMATTKTPRAGFALVAAHLHHSRFANDIPHDMISSEALIAETARVAAGAIIMAGAQIEEGAVIGPHAVIGQGVVIGARTAIGANVTISHATIGTDCRISAGVQIGEAGFGYAPSASGAVTVPQLGCVRIGDRVDIGANSTIDRGALDDTIIGEGTKLDNLVQVAHNCRIGRHVLVAAQTGISGSCVVGDGVMMGGQVGMADHVNIGHGAVLMARSGLMRDVPDGEKWAGAPARPAREWLKEVAMLNKMTNKGKS